MPNISISDTPRIRPDNIHQLHSTVPTSILILSQPRLTTEPMPGSDRSRSDLALSDTLSARSYLELAQNHYIQPESISPQNNDNPDSPVSGKLIELEGNSSPRLRVRTRWPSLKEAKKSEKPETPETPEIKDPPVERRTRKRGRPRLETAKDAAAIEVL